MPDVTFSFLCGIRGYHEYRIVWTPVLNEVLEAKHESHNCHNCYAISVLKCLHGSDTVIGHLPRKSRSQSDDEVEFDESEEALDELDQFYL